MTKRIILVSIALLFAAPAFASNLVEGDAAKGKDRSITCGACHGADGNSVMAGSDNAAAWPSIAGQGAPYIFDQLKAFKARQRPDMVMSAQAMGLSETDMANLAVYFSEQTAVPRTVADASLVAKGEAIYRGGNKKDGTPACLACHGPTGAGNPAASYPALSGQWSRYTAKQLKDYRDGARTSDEPTKVMQDIARSMDNEQIEAVSSYVQGLR